MPKTTNHLVSTKWKPGQSGNPGGSRAYHNRRRAVREVSTESLSRIAECLFDGDLPSLKELSEDPTCTPIEKLCIGVITRAYEKGDANALGLLLDRFIGKPVEHKQVNVTATRPAEPTPAELSDEELAKRAALLAEVEE